MPGEQGEDFKVLCAICDEPHHAKGLCRVHYFRLKKWGSPHMKKAFYRGEQKDMKCPYCGKPARIKRMCQMHYRRVKDTGTAYLRGSLLPYGR